MSRYFVVAPSPHLVRYYARQHHLSPAQVSHVTQIDQIAGLTPLTPIIVLTGDARGAFDYTHLWKFREDLAKWEALARIAQVYRKIEQSPNLPDEEPPPYLVFAPSNRQAMEYVWKHRLPRLSRTLVSFENALGYDRPILCIVGDRYGTYLFNLRQRQIAERLIEAEAAGHLSLMYRWFEEPPSKPADRITFDMLLEMRDPSTHLNKP
ncbi:hypothetical protein KW797_01955 [Candidatus Parcubacteria bacterium]|nr:hypothetical protein [Candidatus Parcubacteria bacterium]